MGRYSAVVVLAVAVAAVASVANAAIVPIGPFVGAESDSYETQVRGQFLPQYPVFNDDVVNQFGGGQGLHITGGWFFFGAVFPHTGSVFMGGAGVNEEYVFTTPADQFGGYFSTNADVPGAIANFYDSANNLLAGNMPVTAPLNGAWTWNGWDETTGVGIKRVEIIANNQFNGFIMNDSMEMNPIPEPGALALLGFGVLAVLRRR